MANDTTARDALARSIASRLLICDELELRQLDRVLISMEKRRDIFEAFHVDRTGEWSREEAIEEYRRASLERRR